MTQHNSPTDAELDAWETDATGPHGLALPADMLRLLAEVRRLRAAPVGYDAALRVAEAVRDMRQSPQRVGETVGEWLSRSNASLAAIVRATLGDDAVARAERAVIEAAIAWSGPTYAPPEYGCEPSDAECERLSEAVAALQRAKAASPPR